jgi:hypothetical protein
MSRVAQAKQSRAVRFIWAGGVGRRVEKSRHGHGGSTSKHGGAGPTPTVRGSVASFMAGSTGHGHAGRAGPCKRSKRG